MCLLFIIKFFIYVCFTYLERLRGASGTYVILRVAGGRAGFATVTHSRVNRSRARCGRFV